MKRLQLLLLLLIAHLDKEHPIAEAKTKLVKELDVFQQVVVAGTSVTVLVVVPRFDIIKRLSTRGENTSNHLLISSLTTGFMLLAEIKACSSLWLVIKGTRHIGTTSEPLGFTCSKKFHSISACLHSKFSKTLLSAKHQLIHTVILGLSL